jgi:hypothetical protein
MVLDAFALRKRFYLDEVVPGRTICDVDRMVKGKILRGYRSTSIQG